MVRRRAPLLVDVAVATTAALARHEERGRDGAVDVGVRRRGKERTARAGALLVHRRWRGRRILDAIRRPPPRLAAAAHRRGDTGRHKHGHYRGTGEPKTDVVSAFRRA